jgi:hypothetical protein
MGSQTDPPATLTSEQEAWYRKDVDYSQYCLGIARRSSTRPDSMCDLSSHQNIARRQAFPTFRHSILMGTAGCSPTTVASICIPTKNRAYSKLLKWGMLAQCSSGPRDSKTPGRAAMTSPRLLLSDACLPLSSCLPANWPVQADSTPGREQLAQPSHSVHWAGGRHSGRTCRDWHGPSDPSQTIT